MKKVLFIIAIIFCSTVIAQKKIVNKAFPQNFVGHWKGTLQWYSKGKFKQSFTMQLIIKPIDSTNNYTWQIIYGDDKKDNRPYILKSIDTATGHWIVDENDGIKIDTYIFGNTATSTFTVNNTTIVDTYIVNGNNMDVQFLTVLLNDKNKTGQGSTEHPFVESYKVAAYQKGVLKKMK
jgi:hypothetical protein